MVLRGGGRNREVALINCYSFKAAFQGDSLSGKIFTLVLATALNHLRAVSGRPNPPSSSIGLPLEWQYADDCDFIDEDMEQLRQVDEYAKQIVPQLNLIVN